MSYIPITEAMDLLYVQQQTCKNRIAAAGIGVARFALWCKRQERAEKRALSQHYHPTGVRYIKHIDRL